MILPTLGRWADARCRVLHGDSIRTYVIDRNINYTNVCTAHCTFCAFRRDAGENDAYTLQYEQIADKVRELTAIGGTQILMQGGMNAALPLSWYERLLSRLKADFPELRILLNGGVDTVTAIQAHLAAGVDGVMIGRKAYADPYWLSEVEAAFLAPAGAWQRPTRSAIVRAMADYAAREVALGVRLHHITRHMLGLYHGQSGARAWRCFLSTRGCAADAGPGWLLESVQMVGGH